MCDYAGVSSSDLLTYISGTRLQAVKNENFKNPFTKDIIEVGNSDKDYLQYYNDEQIKRHNVLPGLTGWAQINGRNSITWSEKFKLDVWYVDNWSLWLDIKIFFLTFWKVIKREGINQSESVTMEYFNGTN